MNYCIVNGTVYAVPTRSNELYHHGVKGMKWGRRKARPDTTGSTRRAAKSASTSSDAQHEARNAKVKKAAKIGAAVAGTALAAYGAYKLSKFVKNKNVELATKRGEELARNYIKENKFTMYTYGTNRLAVSNGLSKMDYEFNSFNGNDAVRSTARTLYDSNKYVRNRAYGLKNAAIRDAKNESLATAAKNVGSHYATKAKTAATNSKVGKAIASSKARDAARKAAERERERLRKEFINRSTGAILRRNTSKY